MKEIIIAFDIDGTLNGEFGWNMEIVNLLKLLSSKMKNTKIIVWSGGGKEYAEMWVRRMQLEKFVDGCYHKVGYNGPKVDIAFDDIHEFNLAEKNIIVRMK